MSPVRGSRNPSLPAVPRSSGEGLAVLARWPEGERPPEKWDTCGAGPGRGLVGFLWGSLEAQVVEPAGRSEAWCPPPGRTCGQAMGSLDLARRITSGIRARAVARRLAAAGEPVSRRALRSGGVTGSNEALNAWRACSAPSWPGVPTAAGEPPLASGGLACQPGQHLAQPRRRAGHRGGAGAPRSCGRCRPPA